MRNVNNKQEFIGVVKAGIWAAATAAVIIAGYAWVTPWSIL